MRPVLHSDLAYAARALVDIDDQSRARLAGRMLQEAQWADKFRKRLGKPHPRWGNGTLSAAAAQYPLCPEPSVDDPDYSLCLMAILRALHLKPHTM